MDAEKKVPSAENPEPEKVISFIKPGVGQKIALHASPASRDCAYFLPSRIIQLYFPLNPLPTLSVVCLAL